MISLNVSDSKIVTKALFKDTVFDDFMLLHFEVVNIYNITVNGMIQTSSLDSDDKEKFANQSYIYWSSFKQQGFSLIKGNKPPSSLKLIFGLSATSTQSILTKQNIPPNTINGFTFSISLEPDRSYKIVTGTNYAQFTLDKSAEKYFDNMLLRFFEKNKIPTTI